MAESKSEVSSMHPAMFMLGMLVIVFVGVIAASSAIKRMETNAQLRQRQL